MTTALLYTRRLHKAMLYYEMRGNTQTPKKRRYTKDLEVDQSCMVGCSVTLDLTYPDDYAARMCNQHPTIDIEDYSMVWPIFNY